MSTMPHNAHGAPATTAARGSLRVTQYTDAPPMSADEVSALIRRATERAMGDMLNDAGEWL